MSIQEDIEIFEDRWKRKKGITMKCVSKKQYECIKLTKENLKEFLRIVEPYLDSKYVFIQDDNDKYCLVKRFEVEKYYFYNEWYVFDWDEATWEIYTDEEFKEEFELVEDRWPIIEIKFKNGSKLKNIESKYSKRSNSMIIKFGYWETTTPENSEEVMKKQILYYQRHPEEYLELVYDNLHLFKYQKLLLKCY